MRGAAVVENPIRGRRRRSPLSGLGTDEYASEVASIDASHRRHAWRQAAAFPFAILVVVVVVILWFLILR
jgi:hypothetical protein